MKTVTVDLPTSLATEVEEAGLLVPEAFAGIMLRARRRQAIDSLLEIPKMPPTDSIPMTMDEIQAEVNAVRAERRRMLKWREKQQQCE